MVAAVSDGGRAAAGFEVRRVGGDEVAYLQSLNALFADVFGEPAAYASRSPEPAYLAGLLRDENFIALVALDDGEVVGGLVAYALRKFEQARSEVYIYDLGVAGNRRRQGIATALISSLKPIARRLGAWVIFVQADRDDLPAIALYDKLGIREEVLRFDIPVR